MNEYNRTTNSTLRPDSVADLAANSLDRGTATLNSHRSYQIQLIDATTLAILATGVAPCNAVPTAVTIDGLPNPAFNNALMVITVTVTWIPKGGAIADEKKIVVSTVLPVLGRTNPAAGATS